jgi:predicted O-linked N-acetylglucosamine transferase (SPINDLY family)
LLEGRDRTRFEAFLYAEAPVADAGDDRLRNSPTAGGSTWGRGARLMARQMRDDRIDILVDLAGHTRNNRLDVLAPAGPRPGDVHRLSEYDGTTGHRLSPQR